MRSRDKLKYCNPIAKMLMATKRDRMMNYLEWLLLTKWYDHIITRSCKMTWKTKKVTYPLTQYLWLSILTGGDVQWGVSFHKNARSFNHVVLQGHVNYFSCCITTTTRPMATKLGKVVTYYKKLNPIKSHSPLNT